MTKEKMFNKKGLKFTQKFIKEPSWMKDIREKGLGKAIIDEFKSKETRQLIFIVLGVAVLFFILGARADCQRDGGLFAFTSKWGINWECYNRSQLENIPIYDYYPEIGELNLSIKEGILAE